MKPKDPRNVPVSKTCPECGAPIYDDYSPKYECWYWDQAEERMRRRGQADDIPAMRKSGADTPCTGYSYDYHQEQNQRTNALNFSLCVALIAIIVGSFWWFSR